MAKGFGLSLDDKDDDDEELSQSIYIHTYDDDDKKGFDELFKNASIL